MRNLTIQIDLRGALNGLSALQFLRNLALTHRWVLY